MLAHRVYILGYHSIEDWEYPHSVSPSEFEWQLQHLKQNFEMLSLSYFLQILDGTRTLIRDAVLLTFDDGVEDNYTNALPILQKYGVPAIIFLATDYVGRVHAGPHGYPFQFLSWEQCRALSQSQLIAIESHTHTHPLLTELSPEDIDYECTHSKELIAKEVGIMPRTISYPKGQYNNLVLERVTPQYTCGFAIDGGVLSLPAHDHRVLPRILISRDISRMRFRLMLTPWYWVARTVRDGLCRRICFL